MANEKEFTDMDDQASSISDTVQDVDNVAELSEDEITPSSDLDETTSEEIATKDGSDPNPPQNKETGEEKAVDTTEDTIAPDQTTEVEGVEKGDTEPENLTLQEPPTATDSPTEQKPDNDNIADVDAAIADEGTPDENITTVDPIAEEHSPTVSTEVTETIEATEDHNSEVDQPDAVADDEKNLPVGQPTEDIENQHPPKDTAAPIEPSTIAGEKESGDQQAIDKKEESKDKPDVDYTNFDKSALLAAISDLAQKDDGFKKGKAVFQINERYDALFKEEMETALNKFIVDGGNKDDFKYKRDETSIKFEEYAKIIKGKRAKQHKEFEKEKEQNFKLKSELLERLRIFVDNDENTASNKEMKKMQEEWRAIGPVSPQHNKTLWANYNALMDRYYDHRSIYFELKDLDKKKNLESKIALCEQAEVLDGLENLNEAIKKLNELHDEFKHLGPIPKENQDEVWNRFKAASDKVYAKRKEYVNHLKESQNENLDKKIALADKVVEFASFTSEKIPDWNTKSKELLALQKEWEAIGGMPKEKAKGINKKFWGGFKTFYHQKSAFFKALDAIREENLTLKQALIGQALSFQESDDWDKTANELKELQKQWKEIGPVPEKKRESIYKKFKEACDTFFNNRRDHGHDVESSYIENLKKKETICDQIEGLINQENINLEDIYQLQDQYNAVGFVPRKSIKAIQNKFQSAINNIIENAKSLSEDDLNEFKSTLKINKIKSGPHGDQKLYRKEHALARKIKNLENDISIWKNNLGFFKNSKSAAELMKDFEVKIQSAEDHLVALKEELALVNQA